MDELIKKISGAVSYHQREKAILRIAVFVGGGLFGVSCFILGRVLI